MGPSKKDKKNGSIAAQHRLQQQRAQQQALEAQHEAELQESRQRLDSLVFPREPEKEQDSQTKPSKRRSKTFEPIIIDSGSPLETHMFKEPTRDEVDESHVALSSSPNDDVSPAALSPEFLPSTSIGAKSRRRSSVAASPPLGTYSTTSVSTGTRMSGGAGSDASTASSYEDHYKEIHSANIHRSSPQAIGHGLNLHQTSGFIHSPNQTYSTSIPPVSQTLPNSLGTSPYNARMSSLPTGIPFKSPPISHPTTSTFHGVSELDKLEQCSGLRAGDRGYHFGFDTLPVARADVGISSGNAVISGYEGGLSVYAINNKSPDLLYSLTGLRGGVLSAKLIPWNTEGTSDLSPLVAVVIHGPMIDGAQDAPIEVKSYQTTVEVYSLKTKRLVDTLLKMPPIPINTSIPITSDLFEPPKPTSSLYLRCDGGFLAVSCAQSGEIFVFGQLSCEPENRDMGGKFGCVAKLWTSVQTRLRNDDANLNSSPNSSSQSNSLQPIFSLNGRWLAYCPPSTAESHSNAEIAVPTLGWAPGLKSTVPPDLPTKSTETDETIGEGMVNKIMRGTTQELIHGARWVGQHGKQAWNSYWTKPGTSPEPAPQWGSSYPPAKMSPESPPFLAAMTSRKTKSSPLICLVDLESLTTMSNVNPFSTFSVSGGCSYLSFSPSGLQLYVASAKGDVQTVWDLLKTQHTKSSLIQITSNGQATGVHVRQIAYFSRVTEARIADVAWTGPNGEQIAVVTERGTIHMLDLPSSAFIWPPPRRRQDGRKQSSSSSDATSASAAAVSMASTAIGVAFGAAPALINRARRSSANPQVPMSSTGSQLVESATQSGRMIAHSISQSIGKTGNVINQLRQTAENRISMLPFLHQRSPTPGCVTWVIENGSYTLCVVGNGLVRMFPSKTRRLSAGAAPTLVGSLTAKPAKEATHVDITMPKLPDCVISEYVMKKITDKDELSMSEQDMEVGNTVLFDGPRGHVQPDKVWIFGDATLPEAEIESSAPYQPFHTDRRITMFEYIVDGGNDLQEPMHELPIKSKKNKNRKSVSGNISIGHDFGDCWAFGQEISTACISTGYSVGYDDDDDVGNLDDSRALPASEIERTMQQFGSDSQIVVTTRRRRVARQTDSDDQDGFFEDDCDFLDFADQRV